MAAAAFNLRRLNSNSENVLKNIENCEQLIPHPSTPPSQVEAEDGESYARKRSMSVEIAESKPFS